MITNRTIIEVEANGREFVLECSSLSTWEDVIQALEVLNSIANEKLNYARAQAEQKAPETKVEN